MKKTYKSLAFIGIVFIVIIALLKNDNATLIKTHNVTVINFSYGTEPIIGRNHGQGPDAEYVKIKSAHGKEYKIYTKKNVSIPPNKSIKIYEYKRHGSGVHYFSFNKKS